MWVQDAIASYEQIMEGSADPQTGFNLLLCYYALGDKSRMRQGFTRLLSVRQPGVEDDDLEADIDDVLKEDGLKETLRERQKLSKKYVAIAAKLVAPVVDTDIVAGFQWVVETLRAQSHFELATEMEIAKALYYMRSRQFEQAIETRKSYP